MVARDCYYSQPLIVSPDRLTVETGLAVISIQCHRSICLSDRFRCRRRIQSRCLYSPKSHSEFVYFLHDFRSANFLNWNSIKTASFEIIIWCNEFALAAARIFETQFLHKLSSHQTKHYRLKHNHLGQLLVHYVGRMCVRYMVWKCKQTESTFARVKQLHTHMMYTIHQVRILY